MSDDLDPGIRRFLEELAVLDRDMPPAPSVVERRAQYLARCRHFDPPRPAGVSVHDDIVHGPEAAVPIRVYRPAGNGRLPAIVYFHGGGWVLGNLDTHDTISAEIADHTGAVVVAVDYRLAPEHPYPAAFHDGVAVLDHLVAAAESLAIDVSRLAPAGDSAGGNLAAALALHARDRGGPALRGQALIYPVLDPDLSLPSCRTNAEGPVLTTAAMREYWDTYLGGARTTDDPYAAPLRASGKAGGLSGLPPAFVATARHDPLSDEGCLYAERLAAAGVAVEHCPGAHLVHGYLRARHLSAGAAADFAALCAALRRMLA